MPYILNFASPIWSPHKKYLIQTLKKVNHKFLRYMAFKFKVPFNKFSHDYQDLYEKFNISPLNKVHCYNDLISLF